jgi:hypothetical protein
MRTAFVSEFIRVQSFQRIFYLKMVYRLLVLAPDFRPNIHDGWGKHRKN